MKVSMLMFWLLFFAGHAWTQSGEAAKKDEVRVSARAAGDIVPLPSIRSLTASQAAGKKSFVQRCAVCHLPALPSYTSYGPLLSGDLMMSWGDAAAREQIMRGSARMPGYQYTLSSAEIDQIVGYLKTLEFTKKD
jgi:mono/diheme cytochrome c family protein